MTDEELIKLRARAIAKNPACVMMGACPPCGVGGGEVRNA